MSAKRLRGEQWIKEEIDTVSDADEEVIDSGSDSDEENEYNLAFCKIRTNNQAYILSTSESEETEDPEIRIDTPSGIEWTSEKLNPKIHDFTSQHSGVVGNTLNCSSKILDYFRLFFSEDLVKFIVEKTNNHWCRQLKKDHLEVSEGTELNELYCFIAASLLMTRNKKLSFKEYWSKNKLLRSDIFIKIMSKDRYFSLLKMLHFTDIVGHTTDRIYKINEVVEMLRTSFNNAFQPYQRLCIDESLLLYKGRLSFKQYILSKRNRFGIKSFVLCDCKTGYIQDIIIYCGASTTVATEYQYIGKPGNIVMSLLQPFLNKGHTVYLDNWFSSPTLFNLLHEKGTNVEFVEVPKKSRKNEFILKPEYVINYNSSSMGTINKSDIVISTSDATCKSLKWYLKYFFHLIDICVWNAFCLYKDTTKKQMSMAKFHLQLIKEILQEYHKNHGYFRCSRSRNNYPIRLTGRHFPSIYHSGKKNRKRRCVVCAAGGVRRESMYQCEQCNVGLCVSPCFKNYHTKLHY